MVPISQPVMSAKDVWCWWSLCLLAAMMQEDRVGQVWHCLLILLVGGLYCKMEIIKGFTHNIWEGRENSNWNAVCPASPVATKRYSGLGLWPSFQLASRMETAPHWTTGFFPEEQWSTVVWVGRGARGWLSKEVRSKCRPRYPGAPKKTYVEAWANPPQVWEEERENFKKKHKC